MATTTKSLRQFLQGSLNDFAESCDMAPLVTATTLTSLVVMLANLREEGVVLLPEVYLCSQLDETLKLLPDREVLNIGVVDDAMSAIAEGIKKCGSLAIGGWCVFISPSNEKFRFGVFRGSLNPLSISVSRTLFSEPLLNTKVVRLFRTASGCVELFNHKNDSHCMLLNDRPEAAPLPNAYTDALIDLICKDTTESTRDPSRTYIGKTIERALSSCHGTIIVVTKKKSVPKCLEDGVILETPLDLQNAVLEKNKLGHETTAEHKLSAYSALIQGMISSDGITVFNTRGKLLAYNCFIHSPNQVNGKQIVGGARTRAYEALRKKIGNGIEAVFIQSQDGWTKFAKE
jgi:hypothetical protein